MPARRQIRTRKDMVALLAELGVESPEEHSGSMWNTICEGCYASWDLGRSQLRLQYVTTTSDRRGTVVIVEVEYP